MSRSETGRESDGILNDPAAPRPQPRQDMSRGRPPQVGRRHYHLLWDEELEALRPILSRVSERLGEVVEHWYQLYVLHFGDQRALSEPEFRDFFYNALSRNTKDLLDGDMDRYAIDTIRTGETAMRAQRAVCGDRRVSSSVRGERLHRFPQGSASAAGDLHGFRQAEPHPYDSAGRRVLPLRVGKRGRTDSGAGARGRLWWRGRNAASSMAWSARAR